MREDSLADLADSIKAQGIIQPIVVRPVGTAEHGQPQRYEIVAGERRWRAAQLAGLHEIPAVLRQIDDEHAVALALIENIQREDLNPLEEALALSRLIGEFQLTHQQAAEAVGRSRAAVSNLLRLLDLPQAIRPFIEKRELEMGHARALLSLPVPKQQAEVGALVAKKGLSVRETEALVRRLIAHAGGAKGKPGRRSKDPDIQRLENDLADKLGATVELQHSSTGKGRLVINYHSLDELDGILAHIS
jgi:ParB family chromosome partitioning protein